MSSPNSFSQMLQSNWQMKLCGKFVANSLKFRPAKVLPPLDRSHPPQRSIMNQATVYCSSLYVAFNGASCDSMRKVLCGKQLHSLLSTLFSNAPSWLVMFPCEQQCCRQTEEFCYFIFRDKVNYNPCHPKSSYSN